MLKPSPYFLLSLFFSLNFHQCSSSDPSQIFSQKATFKTQEGVFTFQVTLADTNQERRQGLMFQDHLTEDQGMLFVYPREVHHSFWMKNTPTSLDIIFLSPDLKVNYIIEEAEPYSEKPLVSKFPYRYVLEVKNGFVQKSGLQLGDQLEVSF